MDETSLIQLVYGSAATQSFSEEELKELLSKSKTNNQKVNITGMLLYNRGSFLQVLEGDPEVVETLLKKISQDKRHSNLKVISRREVEERTFEKWSMGFVRLTEEDLLQLPGCNDFFKSGVCYHELSDDQCKRVLKAFKEGRWRMGLQ